MVLDGERDDLGGRYTLTVTSASAPQCVGGDLPEAARRRSYVATVEQDGPQLMVRLSGADFILTNGRGDHFRGNVTADGNVFFIMEPNASYYFYYSYYLGGDFDLVERFSATSALLIAGSVSARTSGSTISGDLIGWILLRNLNSGPSRSYSNVCFGQHRFEMRRQ